eukprot:CAMPEP_0184442902 /NCGR_PEP_ID=MMETSP0738-20130409/756821_1 /TAXON_ID=385413 /ORGANISM="Thalassiosira miniscula, Strain CCMP1093" /LENGTH=92 /DNA_ID=CAMNT_0026810853 /DNA_START=1946 /DNA_END=2224 /DNA_ORIENTATION=+
MDAIIITAAEGSNINEIASELVEKIDAVDVGLTPKFFSRPASRGGSGAHSIFEIHLPYPPKNEEEAKIYAEMIELAAKIPGTKIAVPKDVES